MREIKKKIRMRGREISIGHGFTLPCTPGVRRKTSSLLIEILTALEHPAPLRISRRSDVCLQRSGPKSRWKAQSVQIDGLAAHYNGHTQGEESKSIAT